jgi:hypothetical protein
MDYWWKLSQIRGRILLGNSATTKGNIMYKIEINIAEWDFGNDSVTIETDDFEKIAIIQEFIEFQQLHGWAVDYDVTDEYLYNQCDEEEEEEVSEDEVDEDETYEDEESEEFEIGEIVEDEDGLVWVRVS